MLYDTASVQTDALALKEERIVTSLAFFFCASGFPLKKSGSQYKSNKAAVVALFVLITHITHIL